MKPVIHPTKKEGPNEEELMNRLTQGSFVKMKQSKKYI